MKVALKLFLLLLLPSCSWKPSSLPVQDFLKYLNDADNGLIKNKSVNDVNVSVQYLPVNYLAYKDASVEGDLTLQDSLKELYKDSESFLLKISSEIKTPAGSGNQDVMYLGASTFEDYKERALAMNFDMKELVSLRTTQGELKPVLATMENVYDLETTKTVFLVFSKGEMIKITENEEHFDVVFKDELYGTGVSAFSFDKADLEVPEIELN